MSVLPADVADPAESADPDLPADPADLADPADPANPSDPAKAFIVDIHTVQKVYSGATKYCTERVQWRLWRPFWILQAFWRCRR